MWILPFFPPSTKARVGRLTLQKLDYLQSALVASAIAVVRSFASDTAAAAARAAASATGRKHATGVAAAAVQAAAEAAAAEAAAAGEASNATGIAREVEMLERTSLADVLANLSLTSLLPTLLSPSRLSEPTFAELIVAWRRQPPPAAARRLRVTAAATALSVPAVFRALDTNRDGTVSPADIAYALRSPHRVRRAASRAASLVRLCPPPPPPPLELRLFRDIPISTFSFTLPLSTPSFSLSDWLRLDLYSAPALGAALASLKYSDPRLDLAAASAVVIWAVRTLLAYRCNKEGGSC
jgi:hypothetical protein